MIFDGPTDARPGAWPTAYLGGAATVGVTDPERTAIPFGYGKGALAAALRALDLPSGANVLLPAAIPRRVPEAIRAAGVEPRFYRVDGSLRPDLADLRGRVDDESAALVAVQYFGFTQPSFAELRTIASEAGLVLVDDASHGALSRVDGRPLGSFGDVGFTSLHKLLPVPDGALLYVGDDRPAPTPPREVGLRVSDYRYATAAACRAVAAALPGEGRANRPPTNRNGHGRAPRSGAAIIKQCAAVVDPHQPEDWSGPMSRLTRGYLAGFDPATVVARRRRRYREWLDVVARVDGAEPLFASLEPGVCPWVCPVVCSDPARFVRTTARRVGGAFRWPTLPEAVRPREYPAAERLSRTLVALPVHQCIPRGRIPNAGPTAEASLR